MYFICIKCCVEIWFVCVLVILCECVLMVALFSVFGGSVSVVDFEDLMGVLIQVLTCQGPQSSRGRAVRAWIDAEGAKDSCTKYKCSYGVNQN